VPSANARGWRAQTRGSVALIDGGVFAAREINDGFAVVDAGGFEVQLLDVRTAARGEQEAVELDLLLHAALARRAEEARLLAALLVG